MNLNSETRFKYNGRAKQDSFRRVRTPRTGRSKKESMRTNREPLPGAILKNNITKLGGGASSKAMKKAIFSYMEREKAMPENPFGNTSKKEMISNNPNEKRIFRVILSPESQKIDHKKMTQKYMENLSKVTGVKYKWRAVCHTNTAQRHTHLLIKGVDKYGQEVLFTKDQLRSQRLLLSKTLLSQGVEASLDSKKVSVISAKEKFLDNKILAMMRKGFLKEKDIKKADPNLLLHDQFLRLKSRGVLKETVNPGEFYLSISAYQKSIQVNSSQKEIPYEKFEKKFGRLLIPQKNTIYKVVDKKENFFVFKDKKGESYLHVSHNTRLKKEDVVSLHKRGETQLHPYYFDGKKIKDVQFCEEMKKKYPTLKLTAPGASVLGKSVACQDGFSIIKIKGREQYKLLKTDSKIGKIELYKNQKEGGVWRERTITKVM